MPKAVEYSQEWRLMMLFPAPRPETDEFSKEQAKGMLQATEAFSHLALTVAEAGSAHHTPGWTPYPQVPTSWAYQAHNHTCNKSKWYQPIFRKNAKIKRKRKVIKTQMETKTKNKKHIQGKHPKMPQTWNSTPTWHHILSDRCQSTSQHTGTLKTLHKITLWLCVQIFMKHKYS